MIEPSGPLEPSVYWRRRVIALVCSVLVVVLLAVIISSLLGRGSQADPQGVANKQGVVPTSSKRLTSSPPTSGTIAAAGASSSSSASPVPTPTTTTGPPPPPPPPGPCPDTSVTVEGRIAQAAYRVGQAPLLTLVITNSGPVACKRDVTRQLRELIVLTADGNTRLWSSSDCYYQQPADVRLLQPGEQATFSIAWAGRTSSPNCAPSGALLPVGDYVVVGKLGNLTSKPTPFKLT
ncbi:hypothetical protein, partial [Kutzneria sp. 744]|uniref:hypothetical protein n=1 Tax=Kutzneria sp. (strain 744) TaxID=345341 RepID=UPI0003EED7D0